jgi:hypothetical protein
VLSVLCSIGIWGVGFKKDMQKMPMRAHEIMGGVVLGKKLNPINYVNNVTRATLLRKHTPRYSTNEINEMSLKAQTLDYGTTPSNKLSAIIRLLSILGTQYARQKVASLCNISHIEDIEGAMFRDRRRITILVTKGKMLVLGSGANSTLINT